MFRRLIKLLRAARSDLERRVVEVVCGIDTGTSRRETIAQTFERERREATVRMARAVVRERVFTFEDEEWMTDDMVIRGLVDALVEAIGPDPRIGDRVVVLGGWVYDQRGTLVSLTEGEQPEGTVVQLGLDGYHEVEADDGRRYSAWKWKAVPWPNTPDGGAEDDDGETEG